MSTDREVLQHVKGIIDAQLGAVFVPPAPGPGPTPTPPVPVPPSGGFVGDGMWLYEKRRLKTERLDAGRPYVEGHFTVPSGYAGLMEFLISGSNMNMRLDGDLIGGGSVRVEPGPHVLRVELTSGAESADGSAEARHD